MAGSDLKRAESWIKGHPYATAGVVFVAGAILIYLYYSGGTTAQASGSGSGNSLLQAQLQSEAVQAQYGAALAAQQSQEQAVATQVNGQVQVAQLAADAQNNQVAAGQTVDLANIASTQTVDLAQIASATTLGLGTLAAQTSQQQMLYQYLGQQTAANYGLQSQEINALGQALLSNSQYTQLEGQLAGIQNFDTAAAGTLGNLSSTLSATDQAGAMLAKNLRTTFPWAGQNANLFNWNGPSA